MFLTNIKRVARFGWQSFLRNKGLGLQVIFAMSVAVFSFTSLLFFKELSSFLIAKAQRAPREQNHNFKASIFLSKFKSLNFISFPTLYSSFPAY